MNQQWWHRAQKSVAQGALTNSKHPKMLIQGAYPTHVSHGIGSYLYDTDGKKYLDYICGLGVNLFGYGNDKINKELMKHIYGGFSHSLPTKHEVEAAEALKEIFCFVDRWKFLKTGSDACSAAIKIARNRWGVRDGNEKMHEMWYREIFKRISSSVEKNWETQRNLQNMCKGTSQETQKGKATEAKYSPIRRQKSQAAGKNLVYYKLRMALRNGILTKKPCEKCGKINSQAQHHDYSKPLDVTWLCPYHHAQEHVF